MLAAHFNFPWDNAAPRREACHPRPRQVERVLYEFCLGLLVQQRPVHSAEGPKAVYSELGWCSTLMRRKYNWLL